MFELLKFYRNIKLIESCFENIYITKKTAVIILINDVNKLRYRKK